jgi:preprotein translocase subunit SecG
MYTVITIIHVLACIFLVLVVLLQTGKGADMGAVFGGSSSTVFGSSGAGTFLTRLTTATAIVFMLTSLSLTYFSARRNTATVFDSAPVSAPASAPEGAPAEPAPQPEANAAPVENPPPAAPPAAN